MQLFANNADSSLNGAIASDTAVLVLKAGEGNKFPSPTNGDFFLVTLFQRVGTTELNHEIVKCTSRVGDNLTVVRAQEGTTAKAFNSGDLVELRFTKGTAENFSQPEDLATKEPVIAAPVSDPTKKYWRGDKTWRDFFTDVCSATLTGLSTATNAVVAAPDTVLTAIGKLQAQVSAKFDKTGGYVDGSINFVGTARRIAGDFSNSTVADRTLFRTNTANAPTNVGAVPNGAGTTSAFIALSKSGIDNASYGSLRIVDGAYTVLESSKLGTGQYLPLTFHAGGSERLRIDPTTGNVLATSGALGYGIGAGGTVVQATSKSTPVTLNKPSGQITMHNASLAAGASVVFQVTNALVAESDCVSATANATLNYRIEAVVGAGGGYFLVRVTNIGTTEGVPLKINFAIEKVALS